MLFLLQFAFGFIIQVGTFFEVSQPGIEDFTIHPVFPINSIPGILLIFCSLLLGLLILLILEFLGGILLILNFLLGICLDFGEVVLVFLLQRCNQGIVLFL